MEIIRVPGWDVGWFGAEYYGWRHCIQIGPYLVLFGRME